MLRALRIRLAWFLFTRARQKAQQRLAEDRQRRANSPDVISYAKHRRAALLHTRGRCTYCNEPALVVLDSDRLCQRHADLWCRAEGEWHRHSEEEFAA